MLCCYVHLVSLMAFTTGNVGAHDVPTLTNQQLSERLEKVIEDLHELKAQDKKLSEEMRELRAGGRQLSDDVRELKAEDRQLSGDMHELKAEVKKLGNLTGSHVVAFFAKLQEATPALLRGIIILPYVLTNVGGGYDPVTGVFTVPVSGLYQFHAIFMNQESTYKYAYAALYLDTEPLVTGISDMRHGYWVASTLNVLVHVKAGQKVMLRSPDANGGVVYYHTYTSFSGFLIRDD